MLIVCLVSLLSLSAFANGLFKRDATKVGCIAHHTVHIVDSQGNSLGTYVFSAYGATCAEAIAEAQTRAEAYLQY